MRIILLLAAAVAMCHGQPFGPDLGNPPFIDFNVGHQNTVERFVVKYATVNVTNQRNGGAKIVDFQTRMYCWPPNDPAGCTVPAATFVMYPGVPALIEICNGLTGLGAVNYSDAFIQQKGYTPYKDADVVNLHTHGLHVNPSEDNVVTRWQNPFCPANQSLFSPADLGNCITANATRTNYDCQLYNMTLPSYHYPGSHWWHTHQHGSVTLQVAGGMYGAIAVTNPNFVDPIPDFNWVMLQYLNFGKKNGTCDCGKGIAGQGEPHPGLFPAGSTQAVPDFRVGNRVGFPIPTRCGLVCQYNNASRQATGADYTVSNLDPTLTDFYLVNGKYQPTQNMTTGVWRRFLFVVTDLAYLFLRVPNATACESYFLSADGIAFTNATSVQDGYPDGTGPRDINAAPYYGTLVVPIGGRADIAIKCHQRGRYPLWALKAQFASRTNTAVNSFSPLFTSQNLAALNELANQSTDCQGNVVGFSMPTPNGDKMLFDLDVTGNPTTSNGPPPRNNPPYSSCPYLKDTRDATVGTNFTTDVTKPHFSATAMQTNNIVFPSRPFRDLPQLSGKPPPRSPEIYNNTPWMATGMNNLSYSEHYPMFDFETMVVHEWTVFIRYHPFHHHTWPYQVQFDFPRFTGANSMITGWWVKGGDWRDVVGLYGSLIVRVNYVALGPLAHDILNNKLVIHCHFVYHEDFGMMQWYQMNNTAVAPLSYTPKEDLEFVINSTVTSPFQTCLIQSFLQASLITSGKSTVISNVLGADFGLELGRTSTNCFYAVFTGTSRTNVDNFFVGYGVTSQLNPTCGAATGIALRLSVYRDSPSATTHTYQAVPVQINPPHLTAPACLLATLKLNCMQPQESPVGSTNSAKFAYRVICFFDLSTPDTCNNPLVKAQFTDVFANVAAGNRLRGFEWSYGEGIGSSQYPEYSNQNVQSCPMKLTSFTAAQAVNRTNQPIETICTYNYFTLESVVEQPYNYTLDSFVRFPTSFPTSAPSATASGSGRVSLSKVVLVVAGMLFKYVTA